jgi:lipopolysaccharide transport system permease protein
LLSKVYFPRLMVPAAAVVAALVDFAIAFLFFIPLMVIYQYGIVLSANLLILPLLVVLTMFLALAVAMWTAALNVKYRDIRYVLPFLIQLWMFGSPIFYWLQMVPEHWRGWLLLNPMTGLLENYRAAFFGLPLNWLALSISIVFTALLSAYALYAFRSMEKTFADVV